MKHHGSATSEQRQAWPKIRAVQHRNGRKAWLVDARIKGAGERLFFRSKVEAETKALQFRIARKNEGSAAFSIPEDLRIEALKCAERLRPFGKTLTDAVDYYLPYLQRVNTPKPLPELIQEVASEKRADGLEKPTIVDFEYRCRQFVQAFPERDVANISSDELEHWLRDRFTNPTSRNNARRAVVNLFNYAVRKKYIPSNPAAAIKKAKTTGGEIGILTPEQIATLLSYADSTILPYFALAAFAGIRPEELLKMNWSDIRWKQGIIRIRAEISKVAASRNIRIEPNLMEWLHPYQLASGKICLPSWRRIFRETRIKAGLSEWPADCLRHSFGTYWLETHRNAPALALEMGNSVEVILRHYHKVLDEPSDAARYWEIKPSAAAEKVVPFAAA